MPSHHKCPAPDCEEQVPFRIFACRSHWFRIPKPLRDELSRAWRKGIDQSYIDARDACIEFLYRDVQDAYVEFLQQKESP